MMERTTVARRPRWLTHRARAAPFFPLLLIVLLSLAFCLDGCATLRGVKSSPTPSARETRTFNASLLHQGMLMAEVRRLEGSPDRAYAMTSTSMSVTEWIYERKGGQARVYFANGVLESWSQ